MLFQKFLALILVISGLALGLVEPVLAQEKSGAGIKQSAVAMKFSPDGKLIALASANGINLYDSTTLNAITQLESSSGAMHELAFDPKGNRIAAIDNTGTLRIWDIAKKALIHEVGTKIKALRDVQFSEDGKIVEVLDRNDLTTYLPIDAETGKLLGSDPKTLPKRVFTGYSAGGRYLAAGPAGTAVKCKPDSLPAGEWKLYAAAKVGESSVVAYYDVYQRKRTVRFQSNSGDEVREFVDGYRDLTLFDGKTGKPLHRTTTTEFPTTALAVSPEGKFLAIGCDNGVVIVFDVKTFRETHRFDAKTKKPVLSLCFSPDGSTCAASYSNSGITKLWALAGEGKLLTGHKSGPNAFAVSADEKFLASVTFDETSVWNLETGTRTTVPVSGYTVRFVHNDTKLFTADDTTFRTWSLNPLKEIEKKKLSNKPWEYLAECDREGKISEITPKSLVGQTADDWRRSDRLLSTGILGFGRCLLPAIEAYAILELHRGERDYISRFRIVPFSNDEPELRFDFGRYEASRLVSDPAGKSFAVLMSGEREIRIYDAKSAKVSQLIDVSKEQQSGASIREFCFSLDSKSLIYSLSDRRLIERNLADKTETVLYSDGAIEAPILCSLLPLKSGRLVIGFGNGNIRIISTK